MHQTNTNPFDVSYQEITYQGQLPPGSTNILAPSSLTFPKFINSASSLSIMDFSFKEPSLKFENFGDDGASKLYLFKFC